MCIRILLADDHKLFRDGLHLLLERQANIKVIGSTNNGRTAIRLAYELKPHVVIIDIGMPGLEGIDAAKRIKQKNPDIKILVFSMHSDPPYVESMLKAGASGYLLKNCSLEELCFAISAAADDKTYFCQEVASTMVQSYLDQNNIKPQNRKLTEREMEVLRLITEGKRAKHIATLLDVSVKTFETHRRNIMEKLKLYSVAELTRYAIKEGIIPL